MLGRIFFGIASRQAGSMECKNSYWLIRHGQSVANATGIVVSSMENGVKPEYGLTEKGIMQAKQAGLTVRERLNSVLESVIIVTSPFSRTIQTSNYAGEALGIKEGDPNFKVAQELRERYFGTAMELGTHKAYGDVWARDDVDLSDGGPAGGESVLDVVERVGRLLKALEEQYSDKNIILVGHGDTLSISSALLSNTDVKEHRQFGMKNCEIREFLKQQ